MTQAADAAQRAAASLEDAASELEQRANALEGQAQQQQLYQLGSRLVQLTQEQQQVVSQLTGLAEVNNTASGFEAQSRHLASQQEAVRQRLTETRRQADKLPTFEWALEQVELDMARATAAAQRYRIDPDAILAASDALTKLELALDATVSKNDGSDDPSNNDPSNSDPQQTSNEEQGRALPPLASLKLLRGLQNQINEQTQLTDAESDQARRNKRLAELSLQQQKLGEQLGELLRELSQESVDEL